MASGWVVVKFTQEDRPTTVEWFEEKFEAQDEADRLNETAPKGTWYGWEMGT